MTFGTYEQRFFRFPIPSLLTSQEIEQIQPSHIRCESYEWFDQLSETFAGGSPELRLNEWSQEEMRENPETLLSENRTETSHLGVRVVRTEEGIELRHIDFLGISESSNVFPFFGDIIGWNLVSGPQSCDLAFNFDAAAFIAQFRAVDNAVENGVLEVARITEETPLELIAGRNAFTLQYSLESIKDDTTIKALASLGFISQNLRHASEEVDVVMIDGSIAPMPLNAYIIDIHEVVQ